MTSWFVCIYIEHKTDFHFFLFFFLLLGSMLEYDTENMNSDEIYSSLRGVTEAIQSFRYRSEEDLNEPVRRELKKDDGVGALRNSEYFL